MKTLTRVFNLRLDGVGFTGTGACEVKAMDLQGLLFYFVTFCDRGFSGT
uniref:Uncharacterized protein n=1 Tax=Physcomitrium patens TaxID=3218 RepID=A0A2K1LAT5_PHYPA|nr:hypothetical protein PHYPA_001565 [Physcomitrium patens]